MSTDNTSTNPVRAVGRREFIVQLETIGAACLLPTLLAGCASVRYVKSVTESGRIIVARAELSASGTALVESPDEQLPIFLRKVSETEFVALSTKCTHRGCQVEAAGGQLVCPCHGSEFALTGERTKGPAEKPLTRFAATSDERNIYISRTPVAAG